ncbi:MAG: PilT/PilU family type 4a pilus ATPase [Thiotrichales bacterium]
MDRAKAIEFVHELLRTMVEQQGSDLFITAGAPPSMKVNGLLQPITQHKLTPTHTQMLARALMNDRQLGEFEKHQETGFSIAVTGVSRFRVSAFMQRGFYGMVLRRINDQIPTFEELNLPSSLREVAMMRRGLVLVVGATGSGKSSTLAALLGFRNRTSRGHIITIEDPVEFVHEHDQCIVTQREIGIDTESYEAALKNALRQAPDVIVLGEIRDRAAMDYAITFAETGHLCMSTVHANSANQAMERVLNFFPDDRRAQVQMDLSLNLRAVLSQRLVRRADGEGRVPAVEVLLNTPLMADLILKGRIQDMKELVQNSREQGMKTFDQALFDLHESGLITYQEALRHADSVNNLRLRIKLESKRAQSKELLAGTEALMVRPPPSDLGTLR